MREEIRNRLNVLSIMFLFFSAGIVGNAQAALFMARDHIVVDLRYGVDWLRCSVGQRLPNREELEGLVCNECDKPKIDVEMFPGTDSVPYWTGQVNKFAKRHVWSVNFATGLTYGRFFPYQQLAVRLVRDRH